MPDTPPSPERPRAPRPAAAVESVADAPPSPPSPPRPRVAAYLVVSSDAARAAAERETLVAFARSQGVMGAMYQETRKHARPKWKLLAERAQKGDVDLVCVLRLEDLSPSAGCVARMIVDVGVRVLAVDGVAVDPRDAWLRWVAEERERQRKRSRRAIEERRQRGEITGEIEFGYQRAPDGVHKVPNPAEQRTISRAVELHRSGLSYRQVAKTLNEEDHHARRGGRISHGQVSRWLRALEKTGNGIAPAPVFHTSTS